MKGKVPEIKILRSRVKGKTLFIYSLKDECPVTHICVFRWKGKVIVALMIFHPRNKRDLLDSFSHMMRGAGFKLLSHDWPFKDEPLRFYVGSEDDWKHALEELKVRGMITVDSGEYKEFLHRRWF